MKHIYASLDIGSDSIKIVVCELFQNKLNLLAASSFKSKGIKKGVITDVELASITIKQAFNEIEQMLGLKLKKVIVSVPSYNASYSLIKGQVAINGHVTSEDVLNSLQSGIKASVIQDRELVTVLPIDYNLDGSYLLEPVGIEGNNLVTRAIMVTVPKKNVYSVVGLLENLGIEVSDISLNTIGDLYAFKNKSFDNKVGAIVNIGADTTTISIYNKSVIVKSSIIDMGGSDIDNDLAYMYKIDLDAANDIKHKFALSHKRLANPNENYEVKSSLGETIKVNQSEASEIVMARIDELLKLTKKELNLLTSKKIDYIIITGGTSNIAGFEYIANDIFGKNINIGNIKMLGIRNNKYSSCIGNIVYFIDKLKLKNVDYSMLTDYESNILSTVKKSNYSDSDSMLGKIFGYFFDE